MEEDEVEGDLRQGVVRQGGVRAVPVPPRVVEDGLADAEEEQADAQAARKQHDEPRHLVVLRSVLRTPELDVAEPVSFLHSSEWETCRM